MANPEGVAQITPLGVSPGTPSARNTNHESRLTPTFCGYDGCVKVSKGVLLAAGRGTRMKDLTADRPKPMLPIQGRPMLAHIVDSAERAGLEELLLVVGYKAELVREYFKTHPPARARLSYVVQDVPNGTGSAALLGKDFAGDDPVLVTFGDILSRASTYRAICDLAQGADGVLAVKEVDDPHGGAAVYVEGDRITRIVEKPPQGTSTTPFVNAGIYCFGPVVFDELERIPLSPRGEYELTDAIHQLLAHGAHLRWYQIEGFWRDIGRPEDLGVADQYAATEPRA